MNNKFWSTKKVLITGHSGFKGSWLSLWLQQVGARLCGVSLPPTTTPSFFALAKIEQHMDSHFADITDLPALNAIVKKFQPDIIIHMAAQPLVRYSYQNPVETYQTNVMGTVNVLEVGRNCDAVKVVLNVTTDKCYENREWLWGYRENEPMGGHDPYSNSKGCSELVTSAYRRSFYSESGKGLASARAGNVIGGGDWAEDRLVPDIINSILRKETVVLRHPQAIRPWQHVLEPLSGYLSLIEKIWHDPANFAEGWNFGPADFAMLPVSHLVEQLIEKMQAGVGWQYPDDKQPHEATLLRLDVTKAVNRLKWQPKLNFDTTLQYIANWYNAWQAGEDVRQLSLEQIKNYQQIESIYG